MNKDLYVSLPNDELALLAIYTLFEVEEKNTKKLKEALCKVTGNDNIDLNKLTHQLSSRRLIELKGYDWHTGNYDYSVAKEHMIPLMTFLYDDCKELTQKVLSAVGSKLRPTDEQKLFWEYIISDFKRLDRRLMDSIDYFSVEMLMPIVADERFATLLLEIDESDFFNVINGFLVKVFDEELLVDSAYLTSLISNYKNRSITASKMLRLQCLVDLYAYMAHGQMPKQLLANNKNHRIIAGIHEAYHGNIIKALEHFKQAVAMNNKDNLYGSTTSSRSFLPLKSSNFFYMLVAFLCGTADGQRKCNSLKKSSDKNAVNAAITLYGIISSEYNEKMSEQMVLSNLVESTSGFDNTAGLLLAYYIDNKKVIERCGHIKPKWLIMRQEMRKYVEQTDTEAMDKAYGPMGLLQSIYRKPEWENVLDDLMSLSDTSKQKDERQTRIGYFMNDMNANYVEAREQSRLKNGTWGSGKRLSMSAFVVGSSEAMNSADREIARLSRSAAYSSGVPLSSVLPHMTEDSRLYVGRFAPYAKVEVTEEMPYLTLVDEGDGYRITSNVPEDKIEQRVIITHRGAASINFIRMNAEQRPYYQRLLSLGFFPREAEPQLKTFLASLGGKVEVNSNLIDGGSTLPITKGDAHLIMQMRPEGKENYVVGIFTRPLEGGHMRCVPGEGDSIIIDVGENGRMRVERDIQTEQDNMKHFAESCPELSAVRETMGNTGMATVEAYSLLPLIEYAQQNPDRISCEWPEGSKMSVRQRNSSTAWGGAIKKNDNGWFEIEGSVEVDQGKVLTMAQLLDLASQSHGRFIRLGEGEFLALSDKLRRQLVSISSIASRTRGKLVMSPFSIALLGPDLTEGELTIVEDDEVRAVRQRIKESSTYSPRVPKELNATLREYQKDGYQWMSRLNKWGAGALLADDMGLGKTIQTITFLLSKAKEGPALVIAPASVAPNWKTEFQKFAPSLNITMLNFEPDRGEAIAKAKAGDVVVTTYGLLLSVKDEITKKQWTSICLDEAHIIKNRGAKTSAVAMKLKSQYRVMLTGTPVQNHLGELWNLFQFVNPGLLGSFDDFNRRFIGPIEQNGDKDVQAQLDRLVKPFMLRRTKDKVAKELPDKEEIYQHVDLSEDELLVYEALRRKAEALLMEEKGKSVSVATLAEITRLRQCACDTRLVEKTKGKTSKKEGSKIIALVELLQTILEGSNGILVFSQFTSYLALIKKALDNVSIPYLYIDGTVPIKERQQLVEKFQAGECPVFLISLKAGGLGLNLTRANYVVHMDPWWNPAIEAQATDRAHRIGQKQNVTVYHLIAEGTIEEKIQRLHEQKRELVENILDSTDTSHKLTGEQLLEMLSD